MEAILDNYNFQVFVYYASYIFAFVLVWNAFKALINIRLLGFLVWGLLGGLFLRARFREPYQIQIKHTQINAGFHKNIAVIADLHLGVYKDESYLLDVISKVNSLTGIDMLVIAGDFTFLPGKKDLNVLFSPLKLSKFPIYAVLGNHDEQKPGPDVKLQLVKALEMNGVKYLENDAVDLIDMILIGLGDHFAKKDDLRIIERFSQDNNVVVLSHNPDVVRNYTNQIADVTIAGHTHCGQIRMPYLYKYMIPTEGTVKERFDCGLYALKESKLFITAGVGEVALPMRFLNKPTIDVLHLK